MAYCNEACIVTLSAARPQKRTTRTPACGPASMTVATPHDEHAETSGMQVSAGGKPAHQWALTLAGNKTISLPRAAKKGESDCVAEVYSTASARVHIECKKRKKRGSGIAIYCRAMPLAYVWRKNRQNVLVKPSNATLFRGIPIFDSNEGLCRRLELLGSGR